MARKSDVILLGVLVGLFLLVVSWPYFSHQMNTSAGDITGNSIRDAIGTFYEASSISQRIFILSQIILLIVIIFAVVVIVRKARHKNKLSKKNYLVNNGNKRSRTDLDILYEILEREKEIDMESIEYTFKINSDVALEWFKILENGELAEINYPRFGKPILSLLEKEVVKKIEEKSPEIKIKDRKDSKGKTISRRKIVKEKKVAKGKKINKREKVIKQKKLDRKKKATKRIVKKRKIVKRKR